jgi:putative peptidoglycan lipid II flippase
VDERPRYAHLVGNNPWVRARQEAEARMAASEASDTGELPAVRVVEPEGGLVRSSAFVAAGTLLSRLSGLIRVGALTFALGSTVLADAYNLANTTPNIVYELLLGGVLSATLVPIFVARFDDGDDDAVNAILTVATVALLVLTVVGVVLAPAIFAVFRKEEIADAGVPLLRLFLPQMLFYGWTALGTAVLNAKRRFAAPAFAPVLNNIVVCGALIAFGLRVGDDPTLASVTGDRTGLWLLGAGTTAGIIAMTIPLLPAIRRAGVVLRWRFAPRHPAVRTVLGRAGWTLGYVAANQVGLTVMLSVAADTADGLPSWYTYAFIFFQLPHGLIAVSVMTTFVPELAASWNAGDRVRFRERFGSGLRLVWAGVLPAAVVLAAAAAPVVAGLLGRGAFDAAAAAGTADVLAPMALGLPGFTVYLFALRGFYATGDTRTPFLVNLVENVIQVALTIALVPGADHPGTALGIAYAVAYSVAGVVALVALHRRIGRVLTRSLADGVARLVACAAIGGAVVLAIRGPLDDAVGSALVVALGLAAAGLAAYLAAAVALRVREIGQLTAAVAGRRCAP